MNRTLLPKAALTILCAAAAAAAHADFEVRDAKGRRILLKDDGTWRYVLPRDAAAAAKEAREAKGEKPADDGKPPPTAELQLVAKVGSPVGCQFDFRLTNTLPYEIRSLVPEFAAYRGDVLYSAESTAFTNLKPGDQRLRSVRFRGITCDEIARLQVTGGDRCEMGDLDRFNNDKGVCLERVKLMPTDAVKFEK